MRSTVISELPLHATPGMREVERRLILQTAMSKYNGMPIEFEAAPAAKAEISRLRDIWDRQFADPADVLMIAWGTTVLHSGKRSDGVVVGFYGKSERPHIEHAIERAFGMEVVFFITEPDYGRFHGRTLDFSPDRGFHLR